MATSIKGGILATDASNLLVGNNNAGYGPYDTKASAVSGIKTLVSRGNIPMGLTVGIITDGTIEEFWVNKSVASSALSESDLVRKNGGNSVAGGLKVEDASGNDITSLVTMIISD